MRLLAAEGAVPHLEGARGDLVALGRIESLELGAADGEGVRAEDAELGEPPAKPARR